MKVLDQVQEYFNQMINLKQLWSRVNSHRISLTHLPRCPCHQSRGFPWQRHTPPLSILIGRGSASRSGPGRTGRYCCRGRDSCLPGQIQQSDTPACSEPKQRPNTNTQTHKKGKHGEMCLSQSNVWNFTFQRHQTGHRTAVISHETFFFSFLFLYYNRRKKPELSPHLI